MKFLQSLISRVPRPGGFRALVRRGDQANADRRWAEAQDVYAAALRLGPGHAWLWLQFGHSCKEQGFLAEAERAYQRALQLEPSEADTHLQLGHLLRLQGEHARAIAAYQAAHRLQPKMQHGHSEIADLQANSEIAQISANSNVDPNAAAQATPTRAAPVVTDTMTLSEVLAAHGLAPGLLEHFGSYFYFQAHPKVRAVVASPSLRACLLHFCAFGLDLGLSIAANAAFDAVFYRETYLGSAPFTQANAYRHWLRVGLRSGFAPNQQTWLDERLGRSITLESDQLALFCARLPPRDAPVSWTAQALRFIEDAGGPTRPTPDAASLLSAVAGRLLSQGHHTQARGAALRQRLLLAAPDNESNNAALAQNLIDGGDLAGAAVIYRRGVARGTASKLSHLRLSECLVGLDLPHAALEVLTHACALHSDDVFLRRRTAEIARMRFDHDWATAQTLVREACAPADSPTAPALPKPIHRVALVGHHPLPQCRFYRLDQTVTQLKEAGCSVELFDLGAADPDAPRFQDRMHLFEAAIFFRVPAMPQVAHAIAAANSQGLVTFYDIDDQIFADPYPGQLDSYAGRIDAEEHLGLALAVPLFDEAICQCMFGIASTETLAAATRPRVRSGQVFVDPNGLGAHHLAFAEAAGPPGIPVRPSRFSTGPAPRRTSRTSRPSSSPPSLTSSGATANASPLF